MYYDPKWRSRYFRIIEKITFHIIAETITHFYRMRHRIIPYFHTGRTIDYFRFCRYDISLFVYKFKSPQLLIFRGAADEHTKLIFLCSPNNPTGNDLLRNEIEKIILGFSGLVILDEAYNDFSEAPSFLSELDKYPNLIVLQTFSKAWGCAAIRLGMAFASQEFISILNKIKYPYNVNQLTQKQALEMLHRYYEIERWVKTLKEERENLEEEFAKLPCTVKIFPSDANFFLVRVTDAVRIYNYLVGEGIIVRNRNSVSLCGNCLRVTVGTRLENEKLLEALRKI